MIQAALDGSDEKGKDCRGWLSKWWRLHHVYYCVTKPKHPSWLLGSMHSLHVRALPFRKVCPGPPTNSPTGVADDGVAAADYGDVCYYNGEGLRSKGETENIFVCAKKRRLYTNFRLCPHLARDDSTAKGRSGLRASIIRSWTRNSR